MLPILLAATHLFAFSAVFSAATQDYLAGVLSRPDSSWLVYTTCDTSDVFTRAGIEVHTEPHGADCRLGGVHLLGRTKPLVHGGVIARVHCFHLPALRSILALVCEQQHGQQVWRL